LPSWFQASYAHPDAQADLGSVSLLLLLFDFIVFG